MDICSICLDNLNNGENPYIIKSCGHYFHRQCIFQWFAKSNTCPYCRNLVHNIFYIKIKNTFYIKKKYVLEIDGNYVNFYDDKFKNMLFFFFLSNLKNMKIMGNFLEIKYIKNNIINKKKLYFTNQDYCLYFYRYINCILTYKRYNY